MENGDPYSPSPLVIPQKSQQAIRGALLACASILGGTGAQILLSEKTPPAYVATPVAGETSCTPDNIQDDGMNVISNGLDDETTFYMGNGETSEAHDLHQAQIPLPSNSTDGSPPLWEHPFLNPFSLKDRFEILAALRSEYFLQILSILCPEPPRIRPESEISQKKAACKPNQGAYKPHRGTSHRTQPKKLGGGYSHHHNRLK